MNSFNPSSASRVLMKENDSLVTLVQQVQEGDIAAFEPLFQARYAQIRIFLIYMVTNDEIGSDLAQETFLKAWQSLPSLRDPACFDSWLYRIAKRLALNHLRRERLFFWLPWREQPESFSGEVGHFEKKIEERILLQQALSAVSPRYRDCVILQLIHEMPQRSIAELLGIKKESVSTFVHRGLEQLHQAYLRLEQE